MAECVHTMQQVFDKYLPSAPKSFNLQPYKADKYFGLLLSDNTADWFKNMLYEFAHEVSKLGTQVAKIPGDVYWDMPRNCCTNRGLLLALYLFRELPVLYNFQS